MTINYRRGRQYHEPEVAELIGQVASLLRKGYTQCSNGSYGHPVWFVKKKNGNLCIWTDYRSLDLIH